MARRRYISTTISTDLAVNRLAREAGDFAALFYTWLIPHAEDDATIKGTAEELLWKIAPGRGDKTAADVEQALCRMAALGLIERDENKTMVGLPVDAFYRYQRYIGTARRRALPLCSSAPFCAESSANLRTLAQNSASLSLSLSPSLSVKVIEEIQCTSDDVPISASRTEGTPEPEAEPAPKTTKPPKPAVEISKEARGLADYLHDKLKEFNALPAGRNPWMSWAIYAERHMVPVRSANDWADAIDWAFEDDWWRSRTTSMPIVATRVWPAYAMSLAKRSRGVRPDPDYEGSTRREEERQAARDAAIAAYEAEQAALAAAEQATERPQEGTRPHDGINNGDAAAKPAERTGAVGQPVSGRAVGTAGTAAAARTG